VIPWSAAAWRRFGLDRALSITKRRQAAALQGGARTQTPFVSGHRGSIDRGGQRFFQSCCSVLSNPQWFPSWFLELSEWVCGKNFPDFASLRFAGLY